MVSITLMMGITITTKRGCLFDRACRPYVRPEAIVPHHLRFGTLYGQENDRLTGMTQLYGDLAV
jgi:hypothetical protein